ncbi:Y-family DNA polymerase [Alicyclobacillus acidiphilus]|uniref:Y-family DNA polymerase n=1 Tax=Alicyclobacillus acidiphilus TaxID=182455 RepID=UPI00083606DC|nr:hypothetical protein [Alicyclobacillus acidiphilus]
MRYTLFGEGEGVTAEHTGPFVTVLDNKVTDASISARTAGIRTGWSVQEAQSMLPGIHVAAQPNTRTPAMEFVCQTLWRISPHVQAVDPNAFFVQIPDSIPPLSEVQSLLKVFDSGLNKEQRFRVGLAENPFLAQALVAWSRLERIPGAGCYRVGRQQLVVSPGILRCSGQGKLDTGWISEFPLSMAWFMPMDVREQLRHLGIERLRDLIWISDSLLLSHFGKQSLLWKNLQEQVPGGKIQSNYPPLERRVSWRAPVDEYAPVEAMERILESLASELCDELQRISAGALRLAMDWRTDEGGGTYERLAKKPIYQPLPMVVQLMEGWCQVYGERLESLDLYVSEVRPLDAVQSGFLLYENAFYPLAPERERARLKDVHEQLSRKFPNLRMGTSLSFRERRLDIILRG